MSEEKIQQYSKKLKLTAISDNWNEVEFKSKDQYLTKLLELEVKAKKTRRTNRLLKQAKFPYQKTLENFKWNDIKLPEEITKNI